MINKKYSSKSNSNNTPATDTSRRRFVQGIGALTGGLALSGSSSALWAMESKHTSTLFTLGVASGDPDAESVVLWTRLAPDPLNGGGMNSVAVEVIWKVATDPFMDNVIKTGEVTAHAKNGHAVRVVAEDLPKDSWLWYQFSYQGEHSRIGRTRTFPEKDSMPEKLRFALVSCQNYQQGYYAAYRDMAEQDLDFILHTGDYIYESGADLNAPAERRHNSDEIISIEDYRNRYALYKLDPNLQAVHAAFPFIVTWDDHEVDNNYAGLSPEDNQLPEAFRQRRNNAYKVYGESMPLRPKNRFRANDDDDSSFNLYRRINFGQLAQFNVLDSRQFRSDQPCNDGLQFIAACPEILDSKTTMLGNSQEEWLYKGLKKSPAIWNVLAQQVMMMQWDLGSLVGTRGYFNVDAWDGYQIARNRVMQFLATSNTSNPIVLTGDIHSSWASDLKLDFNNPDSQTVGAEFVCTGISSTFGDENVPLVQATLPSNPHIKYFDGSHRGYVICDVTPAIWRTDFMAVQRPNIADPVLNVPNPNSAVFRDESFYVHAGIPGTTSAMST